ncbi:MAG: cytochrome c-type biogenesis protein [Hydrogenovibrio sp.]|uniref:cytochrome c-type biogenesis protein n=1 Tax=Hydrogenovibrio sp. TaxID=2065821 RepID=UPI002870243C|nr:cytochrome c-type biogenesis protein [Hydrogenovibrio sp.]MDR9499904.1 cytochrome c-type biogenesis protein [Hydrogenovibrio sp.]
MKPFLRIAAFCFLTFPALVFSAGDVVEFETPEQKKLYTDMLEELRCTVCQNQSLADSNAELAQDLRQNLYQQIKEGADQGQIKNFMVQRYGEFVLYKPVMKPVNYALWFGPFVLLVLGVVIMRLNIRKHSNKKTHTSMTPNDEALLKKYMNGSQESK